MAFDNGLNTKPKEIEMPPLPPEVVEQQVVGQEDTALEDILPDMVKNQGEIEPNVVKNQGEEKSESVDVDSGVLDTEEIKIVPSKEDNRTNNMRALREQNEKIARERDEAFRRLQEYEAQLKPQTSPQRADNSSVESEDLQFQLGDDELAEGKHLSKMVKKIRQMESKLAQYEQQSSATSAELKLKAELPDFDKIVTADNIKTLSATYPDIAKSLGSNPDLYSAAKSAYTIIKNLGIYVEDTYQTQRDIVQRNMAKPKALASVSPQQGTSPLSKANMFADGLTPELKAQLRAEMEACRKEY